MVEDIEQIKCSANWMWAAKLPGEGADLYDAAVAMSDLMVELGIAVERVRQRGTSTLFVQPQFPIDAARSLARTVQVELVTLDPLAPDLKTNLRLSIDLGYTRAARLIDLMEAQGIVGPAESGSKPREVLVAKPAESGDD